MSTRHAYLIIAYAQPEMLKHLIAALDDPRNDIYLHIDKKASFDGSSFFTLHSSLFTLPPLDARWGDVSLVEVELNLIAAALQHGPYAYLHLLSDSDFPIKTQDYIHEECERLAGREFIGYAPTVNVEKEVRNKVQYYYFFTKRFRENTFLHRAYKYLYIRAQKYLGIRRNREVEFKRGSQWCSITGEFAAYIHAHHEELLGMYRRTYCPDEIFVQTLCWASPFRPNIYNTDDEFEGCKRYVNWHGRDIHWIGEENVEEMMGCDRWFARKFQEKDIALVEQIAKRL